MTPPRIEMREMLRRIAITAIPHLSAEQQAFWFARKMSAESGRPVSSATIVRWRNAQHDDLGGVDSRHMDWARARSRTMSANDNSRAGAWNPCSAEAVTGWAA
jgi:hypothetical protein